MNANNDEHDKPAPVSAWRKIMMMNKLGKLQTYRRTSAEFSLIFSFFFLVGLGWRNLSIGVPAMYLNVTGDSNPYLLFAIDALIFVTVLLLQVLWKSAFFTRFFGHPLYQFIDLMSLSNVSLFILDRQFRGFYVHGRSVHPYSDTDLNEMSNNLKREERDLVAKRGLGGTDQQAFTLFVTATFRKMFDKIYSLMLYEV